MAPETGEGRAVWDAAPPCALSLPALLRLIPCASARARWRNHIMARLKFSSQYLVPSHSSLGPSPWISPLPASPAEFPLLPPYPRSGTCTLCPVFLFYRAPLPARLSPSLLNSPLPLKTQLRFPHNRYWALHICCLPATEQSAVHTLVPVVLTAKLGGGATVATASLVPISVDVGLLCLLENVQDRLDCKCCFASLRLPLEH